MQSHSANGATKERPSLEEQYRQFPKGEESGKVVLWARITGQSLPFTHRTILLILSYFADLDGYASPSQDTIALHAGCSRGTVCAILRELEYVGVITSYHRDDLEGYHKAYRICGADNGWRADFPEDEEDANKPILSRVYERLKDRDRQLEDKDRQLQGKNKEIAELKQLLAEVGSPVGQDPTLSECPKYLQEGSSSNDPDSSIKYVDNYYYDDGPSVQNFRHSVW